MALTKKLAKQISSLINEVTVSNIMADSAATHTQLTLTERIEKVRYWRKKHDQAAEVLNGILGQDAVVLFNRKA